MRKRLRFLFSLFGLILVTAAGSGASASTNSSPSTPQTLGGWAPAAPGPAFTAMDRDAAAPFGFVGGYTHPDGQYISADPQVAQTQEPYAYAAGNPVDYIDPTGTDPVPGNPAHYNVSGEACRNNTTWCDMSQSADIEYDDILVEAYSVKYTIRPYATRFTVTYTVYHSLDEGGVYGFADPPTIVAYALCRGGEDLCGTTDFSLRPAAYTDNFSVDMPRMDSPVIALAIEFKAMSAFPLENRGPVFFEGLRTEYAKCKNTDNSCKF